MYNNRYHIPNPPTKHIGGPLRYQENGGARQDTQDAYLAATKGWGYIDQAFQGQKNTYVNENVKYSDENPFDREVEDYKVICRKTKLFVSDLQKTNTLTDVPESFQVEIQDKYRHLRAIRPLQVSIDYTPTATPIRNAFVYFPDFDKAERTSNGQAYHGYFPVIQGAVGIPVLFNFVFQENYMTEFKNLDILDNKFRVRVFKEDATGGIVAFTEMNAFAVEIELLYVDHAFRLEKAVAGTGNNNNN